MSLQVHIVVASFLGFLAFSMLGCSRSGAPPSSTMSSAADNSIRAEAGIRFIKDPWKRLKDQHDSEQWANAKGDLCKVVQRTSTGSIEWEEDYYLSGRTFTTYDGTFPEMLTVHFSYSTRAVAVFYRGTNQTIDRMVMPFENYNGTPASSTNALSVADQVLALWGMSRL